MALSTRVQPIDRDLIVRLTGTSAERSAAFAGFAREQLKDAQRQNELILGRVPPHKMFVDGIEGASEERVRPDGVIVYAFDLAVDLFKFIADQLELHAPKLTGRFARSFTFYADGREIDVGAEIPQGASEYVFINAQPYARKIERGLSAQAPDGVFEAVAALASARFGNLARIRFTFRTPIGGVFAIGKRGDRSDHRTPAISIMLR